MLLGNKFARASNNGDHEHGEAENGSPVGDTALLEADFGLTSTEEGHSQEADEASDVEELLEPLSVTILLLDELGQLSDLLIFLGITSWKGWEALDSSGGCYLKGFL